MIWTSYPNQQQGFGFKGGMAQGFGQPGMNIGYQQQPGMVQPGFQQPGMNMGYPQQGGFPQQKISTTRWVSSTGRI